MPLLKDKLFNIKEFNSLKIDIFCSEIIRLKKIESLINLSLRLIDKKIIIGEGTNIIIDAPKDKIKFEIFNAGDNANQATKKQIVEKIQNYLPKINVKYSKNGSDPRNYKVNFDKVKNVLNFSSSYSIQDGIEEIIKYLQDENLETIRKNRNYYGNYFLKK